MKFTEKLHWVFCLNLELQNNKKYHLSIVCFLNIYGKKNGIKKVNQNTKNIVIFQDVYEYKMIL